MIPICFWFLFKLIKPIDITAYIVDFSTERREERSFNQNDLHNMSSYLYLEEIITQIKTKKKKSILHLTQLSEHEFISC